MPASHIIYPHLNLVMVTMHGRLTISEIIADNLAYDMSEQKRPGQMAFLDTSGVTEFRVTFGGLLAMGKYFLGQMDPFDHTTMTAVYAPSEFMMRKAQIYQRIASGSEANCVGAFRAAPEALSFLGFAPSDLPPELKRFGLSPTH